MSYALLLDTTEYQIIEFINKTIFSMDYFLLFIHSSKNWKKDF